MQDTPDAASSFPPIAGHVGLTCWNEALSDAEIRALAAGVDPRTIRPHALVQWPGEPAVIVEGEGRMIEQD